jgi:mono/diheme cytochrome c family protein
MANRAAYYSQNQGSRIMPLAWMKALRQPDGSAFLGDGLARYGYLANIASPTSTLPVGFTTDGPAGQEFIGMTCAACHTRQIQVGAAAWRIDGGPAIADFGAFMTDIDTDVTRVLADDAVFTAFATAVLGGVPTAAQAQALRQQVTDWYAPYHAIVQRALPPRPWGPARLDAVGMIFNRLTGLDIGASADHIIAGNIHVADSPVRYPFLWNASRQDQTQWPGFADNGDALLALARNTGEVIGVFAQFHPYADPLRHPVLKLNYADNDDGRTVNSANPDGLLKLEDLITRIGPPRWPWPADATLAQQGAAIFALPAAQGGCAECHGASQGKHRLFEPQTTWATPVQDVGTDNRQWKMIGVPGQAAFPGWTVDTGVLAGAEIPALMPKLKPQDSAFNTLRIAVIGTILQQIPRIGRFTVESEMNAPFLTADQKSTGITNGPSAKELFGAFNRTTTPTAPAAPFKFESRVLQGIWATAPYLHNGSVPTLADLLNPPAQRPKSFRIGPEYDPVKVGLAAQQTAFDYTLTTTGCDDRSSGTSNCGHEFGTTLNAAQKAALLEYLKTL